MDAFLGILFQFYGLDWLAMVLGLTGTYFISNRISAASLSTLWRVLRSLGCSAFRAVWVLSPIMPC